MNKKYIVGGGLVLLLTGLVIFSLQKNSTPTAGGKSTENFTSGVGQIALEDISFKEQVLPGEHIFSKGNASPLVGSAAVDIDNDGVDELFIGGGHGQNDVWYRYKNDTFVENTNELSWNKSSPSHATYGTGVVDYDADGDTDIFVARVDGVFYYQNDGGKFASEKKVDTFLEEGAVPTSITLSDINFDGNVDLFITTYLRHDKIEGSNIFNKEAHGTLDKLLIGKGNLSFEDQTESLGLSFRHNTFMGTFVNIDADTDADLVIADDTGSVRIYENQEGKKFTLVTGTPWENKYGYPMGIGVGDIDGNGFPDFFFSNTGKGIQELLLRGDLRKEQTLLTSWTLLLNQGKKQFTDGTNLINKESHPFGWGVVIADIDGNGKEDAVVSENYIKLPQHKLKPSPGSVLLQDKEGNLQDLTATFGVANPAFSLSSLVSDWNKDGVKDIVWVNIAGPSKFYQSSVKGESQEKVVVTTPTNSKYLGSKVELHWDNDTKNTWFITPSEGLGSSQSNQQTFFSQGRKVKEIEVILTNGEKESVSSWQATVQ